MNFHLYLSFFSFYRKVYKKGPKDEQKKDEIEQLIKNRLKRTFDSLVSEIKLYQRKYDFEE